MEERKLASSSSDATSPLFPSSISVDLFGGKESSTSESNSSSGIFNSVFPPASRVVGKDSSLFDSLGPWKKQAPEPKVLNAERKSSDGIEEGCENENENVLNKDRSSVNPQETVEPCIFGSSLHYGSRDIFSHSNTEASVTPAIFKKADGDEDPNASNANSASRGNWWQGTNSFGYPSHPCTLHSSYGLLNQLCKSRLSTTFNSSSLENQKNSETTLDYLEKILGDLNDAMHSMMVEILQRE